MDNMQPGAAPLAAPQTAQAPMAPPPVDSALQNALLLQAIKGNAGTGLQPPDQSQQMAMPMPPPMASQGMPMPAAPMPQPVDPASMTGGLGSGAPAAPMAPDPAMTAAQGAPGMGASNPMMSALFSQIPNPLTGGQQ